MIISEQVSAACRRVSPATLAIVNGDWPGQGRTDRTTEHGSRRSSRDVFGTALAPGCSRKAQAGDRAIVAGAQQWPPALFSGPFVKVLGPAVERGNISMRRAADLLNLGVDDRDELLATHGIESSVEP